ncbi:hypothetical protein L3C95_24415 [Chitinophaga filiformis]|uniref:hypothetical protein n=1 Tax=Chitinophaga filiformis TaxID=104663 RepID=UPI001F24B783|nr:hypothetical protein [Chitinophaga filiformis]MCF6406065.1 hypothetical protein [Chitinophaga filiformis]
MKTFGIIAEGPTDQIVIQNILVGFFDNNELPSSVNFLQPLRDATDEARRQGGWPKVFEYCQSTYFLEAFEQNDYLIIQVDTDVCEHKNFDVRKTTETGSAKSADDLIRDIMFRFELLFVTCFGIDKYNQFKDRLIYAICLDEIECWLLPLYFTDKIKSATNNCIHKLNPMLRANFKGRYIDEDNKNNMVNDYWKFSKPYMKNKILMAKAYDNISLGTFIDNLKAQNIIL